MWGWAASGLKILIAGLLDSKRKNRLPGRELRVRVVCHWIRFACEIAALVVSLVCLSAGQQSEIQNLVTGGNLEVMRWPNFNDYRDSLQKF